MLITRRNFLVGAALLSSPGIAAGQADDIAGIERELRGRIGVSALDTATGAEISHRGDERFAMCSTFKVALVGAILARVDDGELALDQPVRFDEGDLLSNAPVTRAHVAAGALSLETLCAAAVEVSDNTAANLLLAQIGGPAELTAFFRALGDKVTRLDRMELALNSNLPNDPRDTTTPHAMSRSLRGLLLEDGVLSVASRQRITAWMLNERNGRNRMRAGLPQDWRIANKPGTGLNGATNDIGIAWPPRREPIVVSIYLNAPDVPLASRTAAIAAVARGVASALV